MDNKKDTIIDFLHKSKIVPGFLEETKQSTASSIPDEFQELARRTSGERTERSQTVVPTRSPIVPQRQHLKGEGYTIDDCYGARPVSTTKLPTRLTYAGSLLEDKKEKPKEIGGFKGQEPTIHGDWQHKGRVTDF
jgi:hypothetical protein